MPEQRDATLLYAEKHVQDLIDRAQNLQSGIVRLNVTPRGFRVGMRQAQEGLARAMASIHEEMRKDA